MRKIRNVTLAVQMAACLAVLLPAAAGSLDALAASVRSAAVEVVTRASTAGARLEADFAGGRLVLTIGMTERDDARPGAATPPRQTEE